MSSRFLGLTPRQSSSGGKERLGRVSKMGNRYRASCSLSALTRSSSIANVAAMR
nr:transposase [Mesorhizobium sp.]